MSADAKVHLAVRQSNTEAILKLIRRGVDVNKMNSKGFTPLQCASIESNLEISALLLNAGADVNVKSVEGFTALHYALDRNNLKMVEMLIKAGANVNLKSANGFTGLHFALDHNNLKMVKMLIEAGGDVNSKGVQTGKTVLELAIRSKNKSLVEFLLSIGADVKLKNINGETALLCALKQGSLDLATVLVDAGANVNARDVHKQTALHITAASENVTAVEYFILLGAKVNRKTITGETPLHFACKPRLTMNNDNKKKIKCLLNHGANVTALDNKGRTPAMSMMHKIQSLFDANGAQTLNFLLQYSDVNVVDYEGKNVALLCKQQDIWKILLKHVAKMHALDLFIHPSIIKSVTQEEKLRVYFDKCVEELKVAKSTKVKDCWITYFHLLVDSRRKLKNYAGNDDVLKGFKFDNSLDKFPIYRSYMLKNVNKGVCRRRVFDESSLLLSDCLPIFIPSHLIIRDIFDCIKTKDLTKFCN